MPETNLHTNAGPPSIAAPRRFVERRGTYRRETDRLAHRETLLLARSLDLLAADEDPETRLANVLRLLASTAGARRAAVVAGGRARRVAVFVEPGEDSASAETLAHWLDAQAPRQRAQRAADGVAPVLVVEASALGGRHGGARNGGEDEIHVCLPIPSAGDVALGFACDREANVRDLAERLPPQLARHAAVALALVTRQLASERELDDLRAREEHRARFVSTVAHEMRTPLTGLSGYLDLILDGGVSDPQVEREFLERGRSIVASMAELVGDLLELSRLESGSLGLDIASFSVAEVATRIVERLEPIALSRGVALSADTPPRLRAAVADRRRVEQILTNLVGNALKFCSTGGTVEVVARCDGPAAIIAVRDDGAGIERADRERIFERFYRLAGHERITGSGLGLPIARELARAMGGDLDVASVPGAGSAFVLGLPGPVAADPEKVGAALFSALAEEELLLEERRFARAIRPASRPSGRPRLLPSPLPATADRRPLADARPARGRSKAARCGHLRPVDDVPAAAPDPTPA